MRVLRVGSTVAFVAVLLPAASVAATGERAGPSPWPLIVELGLVVIVALVMLSRHTIARAGRALGDRAVAIRSQLPHRRPARPRIGGA
jgi:hypothetical protein